MSCIRIHTAARWVLLPALFVLVGAVHSAAGDIDTDLMQAIEDTNKDLASSLALEDAKSAQRDAAELQAMLGKVETFYVAKGNAADALDFVRGGQRCVQLIRQHVDSKDFTAAAETAVQLTATCKGCHDIYRKKD
jgi:hypothetical protein